MGVILETQDLSIACPTVSTLVVPQNYNRVWLYVCNAGGNNVFLQPGKAAALNTGIRLAASGGYFIFDFNGFYWDGQIFGIADTLASQLTILEVYKRS